jgi:hypothetical protein
MRTANGILSILIAVTVTSCMTSNFNRQKYTSLQRIRTTEDHFETTVVAHAFSTVDVADDTTAGLSPSAQQKITDELVRAIQTETPILVYQNDQRFLLQDPIYYPASKSVCGSFVLLGDAEIQGSLDVYLVDPEDVLNTGCIEPGRIDHLASNMIVPVEDSHPDVAPSEVDTAAVVGAATNEAVDAAAEVYISRGGTFFRASDAKIKSDTLYARFFEVDTIPAGTALIVLEETAYDELHFGYVPMAQTHTETVTAETGKKEDGETKERTRAASFFLFVLFGLLSGFSAWLAARFVKFYKNQGGYTPIEVLLGGWLMILLALILGFTVLPVAAVVFGVLGVMALIAFFVAGEGSKT